MRTTGEQLRQQLKAAHQNKAQKNQDFSRVIEEELQDYHGWSITSLYYAVVQYIDAYRIHVNDQSYHNPHPTKRQRARLEALDKYSELRQIKQHYIRLKTASEQARYEPTDNFDAVRVEDYRQNRFEPIRRTVTNLLTD